MWTHFVVQMEQSCSKWWNLWKWLQIADKRDEFYNALKYSKLSLFFACSLIDVECTSLECDTSNNVTHKKKWMNVFEYTFLKLSKFVFRSCFYFLTNHIYMSSMYIVVVDFVNVTFRIDRKVRWTSSRFHVVFMKHVELPQIICSANAEWHLNNNKWFIYRNGMNNRNTNTRTHTHTYSQIKTKQKYYSFVYIPVGLKFIGLGVLSSRVCFWERFITQQNMMSPTITRTIDRPRIDTYSSISIVLSTIDRIEWVWMTVLKLLTAIFR